MPAAPTGTVTFLFTDIEGSTARWERHPKEMRAALARHDAALRHAVESSGGYIFKTIGDAFCAAFGDPFAAITAAARAQRALASEDFSAVDGMRVRMALHAGSTHERDGDYFGPTVNRVARLLSIGHGGQILASGAVADLIERQRIDSGSLRDLGMHRLKDLTRAERVYQIDVAGLPTAFPALNSLDLTPHNLPVQVTSFVGRETAMKEAVEMLDRTRLLTLTGAGGVGKTRMANQIGAELQHRYPDGVWLIELAALADPVLVAGTVAEVVGAKRIPSDDDSEAIVARLRDRRCLLLLDNCEHVIDAAARVTDTIIRSCKHISIVATSREPLRIGGETTMRLPSLDVPERDDVDIASALSSGAVRLFADRARAADPGFDLGDREAASAVGICRRLDGIPLAIELAAARVTTLGMEQLERGLDDRFRLLTGGSRAALPRQQTMRALIDWSHDLLSDAERAVFSRLAVFAGGWSLDAAEAICAPDEDEVLEHLFALVTKSLVVVTGDAAKRYTYLETTRAYAQEKLATNGAAERIAERHAVFFSALADRTTRSAGSGRIGLQSELDTEIDNIRAALAWAIDRGANPVLGGRIAVATQLWWFVRGHVHEAIRWLTAAIEKLRGADDRLEAELWHALASSTFGKRSVEAARNAQRLADRSGDEPLVLRSQYREAAALHVMGRLDEASALLPPAKARFDAIHDEAGAAACATVLGLIAIERGNLDAAESQLRDALRRYRSIGDDRNVATSLGNLGEIQEYRGDIPAALKCAEDALAGFRAAGHLGGAAGALCHIARARLTIESPDAARPWVHDAVRAAKAADHPLYIGFSVKIAAQLALRAGAAPQAARLWGYVDAWLRESGSKLSRTLIVEKYRELSEQLVDAMPGDRVQTLVEEGATWDSDRAVQEALLT